MNKIVLMLLAALSLSACKMPNTVVGHYDPGTAPPPALFRWQKQGQVGNTDPEQRKEDVIGCGYPAIHPPIGGFDVNLRFHVLPGETTKHMLAREEKFDQCMKDKGYEWQSREVCGMVKENRGICK